MTGNTCPACGAPANETTRPYCSVQCGDEHLDKDDLKAVRFLQAVITRALEGMGLKPHDEAPSNAPLPDQVVVAGEGGGDA